jgi:predicted transcriptional regulator
MTIMKNLNDKGYLKYYKDGNTFVYSARKKPQEVQSSLVSGMIDKVFKGSTSALVQTLVKGENISDKELKELREMIDNMEEQ